MDPFYSDIDRNSSAIDLREIPVLDYDMFYDQVSGFLNIESRHCISYFGVESSDDIKLFCCIADDTAHTIRIFSCRLANNVNLVKSLTPGCPQLHIFERELHENSGLKFEGHKWLKPVRYPHDRRNTAAVMNNYPFYEIETEELHEVGVGPIHAGVIEPGYFRFICNGEKVLHLEIQLGYQHRGVEKLFVTSKNQLQRSVLSECISGDTSVGHSLAHSQLVESLSGIKVSETLQIERCIALELERIAVHIGDTAALCGDVAYQLGQVVCEALRTEVINTTQNWCGNRFGKGLIRPGGSNYPLNDNTIERMLKVLENVGFRYEEITNLIYSIPSVLARFEDIGQVTRSQALNIGAVGMAARTCGILRDIRISHPYQFYDIFPMKPVLLDSGDVLSRGLLRAMEVVESIKIIRQLSGIWQGKIKDDVKPVYDNKLEANRFAISMVEGWRGEICHSAITDEKGDISYYKVKDPSFHNWMALALAVRNQEISDFPVCNKSFNLSYCGNDL